MRPLTGILRLTLKVLCKNIVDLEEYIAGSVAPLFPCKNINSLSLIKQTQVNICFYLFSFVHEKGTINIQI